MKKIAKPRASRSTHKPVHNNLSINQTTSRFSHHSYQIMISYVQYSVKVMSRIWPEHSIPISNV